MRPQSTPPTPCGYCGTLLQRPLSRIKANQQFCDHACHTAYQQRSRIQSNCDLCGKAFERPPSQVQHGRQGFCSEDCRVTSLGQSRARLSGDARNTVCTHCGMSFTRKPSQIAKYRESFCSRECARLGRVGPRPGQVTGEWIPCEVCEKQVWRTPATKRTHVFCSRDCAHRVMGEVLRGRRRVEYIGVTCPQCGTEFEVTPARHKRAARAFCSSACQIIDATQRIAELARASKGQPGQAWTTEARARLSATLKKKYQSDWVEKPSAHSTRMTAEGNPQWRDGESLKPYSPGFTKHRKRIVLARDGYRCRICSIPYTKASPLPIHHFDGGKADHSLANLIALCHSCHALVHQGRICCPTP